MLSARVAKSSGQMASRLMSGKAKGAAAASPKYVSPATPAAPAEAVGPGATKDGNYKCTEYYGFNRMSYYDLEEEMVKDRLPQPVADNGRM